MSDTNTNLIPVADELTTTRDYESNAEMHVAAQIEEAKRMVEARFIVAVRKPRNLDLVRQRILKDCCRPGFAAKALYRRPVGGGKEAVNFSIRFAERMAANYGNLDNNAYLVVDTPEKAVLRCFALDLETNTSFGGDILVEKTVERKDPQMRRVREWRQNSFGDPIAIVTATADEMRSKIGAERSRGYRDNVLRLIPFDLLEECRAQIDHTNNEEIKRDPDAARKKVADRFAARGVLADQLVAYLGHSLEVLTVTDIEELTAVANFLDEGGSWSEIMRAKEQPTEGAPTPPDPKTVELRERLQSARKKKA